MSKITIELKLEVVYGKVVNVPGCEPASSMSSPTLAAYQQRLGLCKNSTVDIKKVLEAIPGSTLVFGSNYNSPRQRWLVLPPFDPLACPCVGHPDWYSVIRSLADGTLPVTENFDACNLIGQGFCPSPDFKNSIKPLPSTYINEGSGVALNYYTP